MLASSERFERDEELVAERERRVRRIQVVVVGELDAHKSAHTLRPQPHTLPFAQREPKRLGGLFFKRLGGLSVLVSCVLNLLITWDGLEGRLGGGVGGGGGAGVGWGGGRVGRVVGMGGRLLLFMSAAADELLEDVPLEYAMCARE